MDKNIFPRIRAGLESVKETLQHIRDEVIIFQNLPSSIQVDDAADFDNWFERWTVALTREESVPEAAWTVERKRQAYQAVIDIMNRISSDPVEAALLFVDAFGGTELRLAYQRTDPNETTPYAETTGRVITLYLQPSEDLWTAEDRERGEVVHTAQNIVHEFGHVLAFAEQGMYDDWNEFVTLISNLNTTEGWSEDDFDQFANRVTLEQIVSYTGEEYNRRLLELRHEQLANMFQAWVYSYTPERDSPNQRQSRAAWAAYSFMTGECPPDDVHIDLTERQRPCGEGILHWIREAANNE